MANQITITPENGSSVFYTEKLTETAQLSNFHCSIDEYNEYLMKDALRSQKDHVAFTWLLLEKETDEIVSYMSLIADAIKLSVTEKSLHSLNYPFKTIPSIKIAKLSVDKFYREKYKGIGSFMIYIAKSFAIVCDEQYIAARFLTVDADIEHNASVLNFYKKNEFLVNEELCNKNRKTISMRRDIYM
ncbi:MAG: hypothetical protein FWB90_02465 [Fibromonadales bacterium]|nr:hypothetical protein [Fibromonadales bacterium]